MLNESLLLPRLQDLTPGGRYRKYDVGNGNHDDPVYSLYANPAYRQLAYVFSGFQNPAPGSRKHLWNSHMSSVRESVEWGFSHINKYCAFLNFHAALNVFQSPVTKYDIFATSLCNLRTCYYGNQTMRFLNAPASESLTIHEYLALACRLTSSTSTR
jgi:hypothetical protein